MATKMIGKFFFIWLAREAHESKYKSGGKQELNLSLYIDNKKCELSLLR
jgi:hypothetical protein